MASVVDWPQELAENANAWVPLAPGDERVVTDRYVLWLGQNAYHWNNVAQRFRFAADELDDVREEIHEHLRRKGRTACAWEVGTSATPSDLVDRLLALGLVDDPDPYVLGMVLTEEPREPAPEGVEVRRAVTEEDHQTAAQIAAAAFGQPLSAPLPEFPGRALYLAYVDGVPVARGSVAYSEGGVTLFGGATLPEYRGRGAYRALVWARWRAAVEAGTPVLVVQAGRHSAPILARLGFREIATVRVLVDVFG